MLSVICCSKAETEWIEETEKIKIDNIKWNGFIRFASIFVKNIEIPEESNIEELTINCCVEDEIEWIDDCSEITIRNAGWLILQDFATKIITKIDLTRQKGIDILSVSCTDEKHIKWIKDVQEVKIRNIEKVQINELASKFVMKLNITKSDDVNYVHVICNEKKNIEWMLNSNETDFPEETITRGLVEYAKNFVYDPNKDFFFHFKKQIYNYESYDKETIEKEDIISLTQSDIECFTKDFFNFFIEERYYVFLSDEQFSFITTEQLRRLRLYCDDVEHDFFQKLNKEQLRAVNSQVFQRMPSFILSRLINSRKIDFLRKEQIQKITINQFEYLTKEQMNVFLRKHIRNIHFQKLGVLNIIIKKANKKNLEMIEKELERREREGEILNIIYTKLQCHFCLKEVGKELNPYIFDCYHCFGRDCLKEIEDVFFKDKIFNSCPLCNIGNFGPCKKFFSLNETKNKSIYKMLKAMFLNEKKEIGERTFKMLNKITIFSKIKPKSFFYIQKKACIFLKNMKHNNGRMFLVREKKEIVNIQIECLDKTEMDVFFCDLVVFTKNGTNILSSGFSYTLEFKDVERIKPNDITRKFFRASITYKNGKKEIFTVPIKEYSV